MATIGIDLGSKKAVMGVVRAAGIDIILNDASARSTEVQVAYCPQERLVGNNVNMQLKKNMKSSILFPTRMLGLNQACKEQIALEQRFTTQKFEAQDDGKVRWDVTHQGQPMQFTIEQVLGFYLSRLRVFYEQSGVTTKDVVISIPSYATNVERQALLDASEIAGFKCLRIINESTAICLNYGFFRKADLEEKKARTVAFVDFGHSKTTVTIAKFVKGLASIVCHHSDRNLGAREFDYQIMMKLGEEFKNKYGCDPRKNDKCKLRMLDAIEKGRKLLSSIPDTNITIEFLMEDEDLSRNLTRDEFQELIDPQLRQFNDLLTETIKLSGLTTDEIDFVELIGDATRTPILMDIMKQVFNKPELNRTLNSLECIGRGASLQAAMLSPHFNVSKYVIDEWNSLPVNINYKFAGEEKPHEMQIIKKKTSFPVSQKVTFENKTGNCELLVKYADTEAILPGLPREVARYDIKEAKLRHAEDKNHKYKFLLVVSNNIHQIPCLESASLQEEWTEEQKIPKPAKKEEKKEGQAEGEAKPEEKPAAEPEVEFEIKVVSKSTTSKVNFETSSYALTPDQRQKCKDIEQQLYMDDRKFLDWKQTRNDLEAYSYKIREKLEDGGPWVEYCEGAIRTSLLQDVSKTVDWLYDDGEDAPLAEYQDRFSNFTKAFEPVNARAVHFELIPEVFKAFQAFRQDILTKASEVAHLTDDQRKIVSDKVSVAENFFQQIQAEMDSQPKFKDPSQSLDNARKQLDLLKAETTPIVNSKPPAPKAEEKKDEPMKDANAEGSFQNEAKAEAGSTEEEKSNPEGANGQSESQAQNDASKDAEMKE